MNTTEVFWDVDGVSLQTYAWNITTLGGDREAPPPIRGEDVVIPYRPGDVWVPKVLGPHIITLGMWVIGTDENGKIPTDRDVRRQYDDNWRKLRRLLFTPRRQFTLTKRFWVLEADLIEGGVNVDNLPRQGRYRLLTARAQASYAGGLIPERNGAGRGVFTVDIKLNDPFFYSDPITVNFSLATGGTNPGPVQSIFVLGDDQTTRMEVEFTGPLTTPKIENLTNGVWFRYNTTVSDGIQASLDVHDFQARHDLSGTTYRSAGYVQHDGDPFWLTLMSGDNELKLSSTGGTGTAKLIYQPGWF